jgi:hypothetical protein
MRGCGARDQGGNGLKLHGRGLSPAGAAGAPVDSPHWPPATWHILSVRRIRFLAPLPPCQKIVVCTLWILDRLCFFAARGYHVGHRHEIDIADAWYNVFWMMENKISASSVKECLWLGVIRSSRIFLIQSRFAMLDNLSFFLHDSGKWVKHFIFNGKRSRETRDFQSFFSLS